MATSFVIRAKRLLGRDMRQLVLPILVEQTLLMFMGVINSVMASHIGTQAVSAIGMVDSLNNLIIAFFSALSIGATVVIAHYTGRGDTKNANETVKQSLYAAVMLVVVIMIPVLIFRRQVLDLLFQAEPDVMHNTAIYLTWSALSYPFIAFSGVANGVLRGAGDGRTPMKVTLLMNIVSAAAGYVFIYGIPLPWGGTWGAFGITGAAAAIFIARGLGAVLLGILLVKGTRSIQLFEPLHYKPHKAILRSIFSIGLPASTENLLFNLGKVITQTFIVACGTAAIAANYYTGTAFMLINLPGNAMNMAAATLVGQCMGRGEEDNAKRTVNDMVILTMGLVACMGVIMFPLAGPFIGLYGAQGEVARLAILYVHMSCITMPLFWSSSFIIPSGLRAMGDAKFCMSISIASMFVVRIGLGYLFALKLGMGVAGVWVCMYADWLVRGVIYTIRLRGDKWRGHKVIGDAEEGRSVAKS